MTLSICTAVCGGVDITRRWLSETVANTTEPRQVCVAFNGCTDAEVHTILLADRDREGGLALTVDPEPQGSAEALNCAVRLAGGECVAVLHNDLMLGPGWDVAVEGFLEAHPEAGVIGFAGAKKLGRDDIYRSPYQLVQLAREDVWTSLTEWQPHGRQATVPVSVAVLDGLAICCRKSVWDELGGFDQTIGRHHIYDIDLSLRALDLGLTNYVIPVSSAVHVSGQTANGARYQDKYGPDAEVHRMAHEVFYCKWHNRLPIRVA